MTTKMIPYITLDGQAEAAISFYQQVFEAQLLFKQTFGEGPADPAHPMDEATGQRIAHSLLKIGASELYIADSEPGQPLQSGNILTICLTTDDAGTAAAFFHALEEGGHVLHPLVQTYFSPAYGMVTDKYGVTFQIFTRK
ncbi:VOC family protein [Paenibacillus donghaensis]|uniref:Glyoxalase/fosfomycin resistance/dioxygenase domain-containing protein n=1 Tax=Paenibacillus donghaensis TaxID=414771 RepID=A0A2Z2KR20_9BACL|nr:VOC family protein [Paenibacillus donghaensis]ASA25219.1 hypothetical protein B9T62_33495 [Paenibacillus donghaensis]